VFQTRVAGPRDSPFVYPIVSIPCSSGRCFRLMSHCAAKHSRIYRQRLNPLFIRAVFQTCSRSNTSETSFLTSQSLVHQGGVSDRALSHLPTILGSQAPLRKPTAIPFAAAPTISSCGRKNIRFSLAQAGLRLRPVCGNLPPLSRPFGVSASPQTI